MTNRLNRELSLFKGVWKNGYYEGDPLDPLTSSSYGQIGYISVLHAIYLRCIKPYVKAETVALEIGVGRGAWTKTMLGAKEVWALDALAAADTRFWEYIGSQPNVKYLQVNDFNCKDLPDDHFDYLFSFGCLCHVSFEGIEQYAQNLFPKLKSGSNCFWLIADYEKYNRAVENLAQNSIWTKAAPVGRRYAPIRKMLGLLVKINEPQPLVSDADNEPRPGRWYHAGTKRTCEMLESCGYKIVDQDTGTSLRDPIIHFMKP